MLEGIPGGMSSAQLPHGCINALAPMIHHAKIVAVVTDGGDRLDIMSSMCEVSLSIHRRLVKELTGPVAGYFMSCRDQGMTAMTVIWESWEEAISSPRERKNPDEDFVCDGRFLDSFPAQMIAYRLS